MSNEESNITKPGPGTPMPPQSVVALKPGDVVGDRYEIVRLIGEGGMGAVFEAKHRILGRAVAVKVLKPEIARQETFAARFLVEAKAAAELHHRNIVELTDYGVDGDRPYMVMEILRGESLAALLHREGALSMQRVVALIDPVLRALAMAHDRGVVHRDIKPENIFLVREDDGEITPKIVDFGIAKRQEESVQLTSANMALGTPAYMAPEQIMSSRTVTGAADQYAVGVTIYEALTGRNPYDADTLNAFIVAKATQDPFPLEQLRPDLDPRFVAVVTKTLARKPEDRFPTIGALREAMATFRGGASLRPPSMDTALQGSPTPPRVTTGANPLAATQSSVTPPPPSSPTPAFTPAPVQIPAHPEAVAPRPAPSRTGLYVGVAVLLVAVVAGVAVVATRNGSTATHANNPPPAAPDAAVQQRETQVVFAISVREPATATIRLDGEVVGNGRAEVVVARDGRRHQLAIEAPGYGTHTEVLTADRDVRIEQQLVRATGPTPTQPTPPSGTGRSRPNNRPDPAAQQPAAQQPAAQQPAQQPAAQQPAQQPAAQQPDAPREPRRNVDPAHPTVDPTNPFQ